MEEKIVGYLSKLEKEKDIQILLACETGSRAWGFPSPDSDYDVRMLYMHRVDWYLNLDEQKDTIECFYENNDIDISGWDLRKTLRLLRKSNPPLLERIQSPIVYHANDRFLKGINELAISAYSRIATIHHYLSMAKKTREVLAESDQFKLKKFFYALRASVACKWILETTEIPPIVFKTMLDNLPIPTSINTRIEELIDLKSTVGESYIHQGEQEILTFMDQCIAQADRDAQNLPSSRGTSEQFNNFFLNTLHNR